MLLGGVERSPFFVPKNADFGVWGYTWGYSLGLHFDPRKTKVWGYIFAKFGVTLGVTFALFFVGCFVGYVSLKYKGNAEFGRIRGDKIPL